MIAEPVLLVLIVDQGLLLLVCVLSGNIVHLELERLQVTVLLELIIQELECTG